MNNQSILSSEILIEMILFSMLSIISSGLQEKKIIQQNNINENLLYDNRFEVGDIVWCSKFGLPH